jgi:AcrR family transcriptional regulator
MRDGTITATGYHHGNLRAALLDAAAGLLASHGLENLSLREVARRAGVSHAAPKHHFGDKAGLVASLVAASFSDLATALRRSARAGTGAERLRRLGYGYVRWAIRNPERFRLLFRPELRGGTRTEEVAAAADAAYELLLDAVEAGQADGSVAPGSAAEVALAAWSAAHGVATLILDGPFRSRGGSLAAAERAIDRLIDGFRP